MMEAGTATMPAASSGSPASTTAPCAAPASRTIVYDMSMPDFLCTTVSPAAANACNGQSASTSVAARIPAAMRRALGMIDLPAIPSPLLRVRTNRLRMPVGTPRRRPISIPAPQEPPRRHKYGVPAYGTQARRQEAGTDGTKADGWAASGDAWRVCATAGGVGAQRAQRVIIVSSLKHFHQDGRRTA